jgi:hypothetical protein
MNPDPDLDRRRLAYRQAGRAVARHIQGRRPEALSLAGPGPGVDGPGSRWPVDLGTAARHRLEMEILAGWAGLLAEARAVAGVEGAPPAGWGAALEPLAALARRVTRSEAENEAYLEWLRRRAEGLLDLPQIAPAVEAVAAALLDRGRLAAGEVVALIAATPRPRRRWPGWGGPSGGVR